MTAQARLLTHYERYSMKLSARANSLLAGLEQSLTKVALCWMLLAMSACSLRVAVSPTMGQIRGFDTAAPYVLVVLAPAATLLFGLYWLRGGEAMHRPERNLARPGKWTRVDRETAQRLIVRCR